MNIVVSFQDRSPSERLALYARTALAQALDRFDDRIRDVMVRIRDENGPKGGLDQHCSLAVRADAGIELHLHDTDSSAEAALRRLGGRAARMIRERLARLRQRRRR
jgi:putative sigma-54 modulation protein